MFNGYGQCWNLAPGALSIIGTVSPTDDFLRRLLTYMKPDITEHNFPENIIP